MSTESTSASSPQATSGETSAEAAGSSSPSATAGGRESDARYASQAAAAEPAPVAFEGGAATPSGSGGTTGRREWTFLVLAVFFSLALVSVPALLFTSIDLTAVEGGGDAPEGSSEAREIERLQLLQETRSDALSKLYTYGPTDDGAYRIPVEEAMRLTQRDEYAAVADSAASADSLALR